MQAQEMTRAEGNGESLITLSRALAACGRQRFANDPSPLKKLELSQHQIQLNHVNPLQLTMIIQVQRILNQIKGLFMIFKTQLCVFLSWSSLGIQIFFRPRSSQISGFCIYVVAPCTLSFQSIGFLHFIFIQS